MEIEQPLLVLRPKFRPITTLLSGIPRQIFFTIWAGGFCGVPATFILQVIAELQETSNGTQAITGFRWHFLTPFVFFGLLAFFGVPIADFLRKWGIYANTEYRFFRTSLEYYEGFFTIERKKIDYRNISEITVRKGPLQRMYGLGNLLLSTAATGTQSGISRSGIVLVDIEDPQTIYRQIRELMRQRL